MLIPYDSLVLPSLVGYEILLVHQKNGVEVKSLIPGWDKTNFSQCH
jgi:hypothetical protein